MIRQSNAATSFSVNARKSISASRSIQITWLTSSNLTCNTFAKVIWEVFKTKLRVSHHLWLHQKKSRYFNIFSCDFEKAFHATLCIFSGKMRIGFLKPQTYGKFSSRPRFFLPKFFLHNFFHS